METFTEQEAAEAFGVELEETGSESGQETPDGQEGQGDGQEAEMSAEAAEEAGEGHSQEETVGQEETGGQRPEMSAEERHRQAAARRAREDQARAAAEQARVDKVYADMFAGQVNPYTGRPILTEADFRAYQTERAHRQQTEQLQQAGIQPETIRGIVDQQLGPVREQLMQAQMQAAQEKARAVNQQAEQSIQASLRNISAVDPSIKTLEDIAAMPTAAKFNALVQKGIGLEDAFYLANRQAIDAKRAAAAKTAALNGAASRQHLNPVSNGGGELPVEVPRGVVDAYRAMMPDATDAEIRKAYAEEMKNLK